MAATFVVTLREGFEAALLLGIVYACLDRFGARDHYRWVTLGGALGLVASILMGIAVTLLSGPLLDLGPDLVAAAVIFAAVGLLTWHGWWMSRHAQALRGDVQRRVAEAEATRRLSVLGLIAFTGVFREGAGTVLFRRRVRDGARGLPRAAHAHRDHGLRPVPRRRQHALLRRPASDRPALTHPRRFSRCGSPARRARRGGAGSPRPCRRRRRGPAPPRRTGRSASAGS